jgi:hypothetical protein
MAWECIENEKIKGNKRALIHGQMHRQQDNLLSLLLFF